MKNFTVAVILLLFTCFSQAQACEQMAYGGKLPQTEHAHVLLCKKEFAVGYSTVLKNPLFVVQRLEAEKLTAPTVVASAPFRLDPSIPTNRQPALSDFVGSGFDRGHMAPFEDVNHDAIAAVESMMLSNIIPQHAGNNRGIWRVLESNVRNMAVDGDIFVITGPIFEDARPPMGQNRIPVPSHLFKVIVNPARRTIISYIVPNDAAPAAALPTFIVSLAEVQRRSGVDPLPILRVIEITR